MNSGGNLKWTGKFGPATARSSFCMRSETVLASVGFGIVILALFSHSASFGGKTFFLLFFFFTVLVKPRILTNIMILNKARK